MLGYRHAFHAGNHADVLKHVTLLQVLDHLTGKDKPFWYIDTHAGAGCYALAHGPAAGHGEHLDGVARLWAADALPGALADYVALLRELNPHGQLQRYPGSPWIARARMRARDHLWLHELHPTDHTQLARDFATAHCHVHNHDGFAALKALLPPEPRRALVLIDPSYEMREDYTRVPGALQQALQRFATGVYLVWYPLIARREARELPARLAALGAERWLRAELVVAGADHQGLYGSGVFVINPPWMLEAALGAALAHLVTLLGRDRHAGYSLQASPP